MARRTFGTVRKLPSGKWQCRYTDPNSKQVNAPSTFLTKADASRWLSKKETEISSGKWIEPSSAATTFANYAEEWLKHRTKKGEPLALRTQSTYRHSLDKHLLPTFGAMKLTAVTPAIVRSWHARTLPCGKTATRQAYSLLRAIFNTALRDEIVTRNPVNIVGAGSNTEAERPLMDLSQLEVMVNAMPEHLRAFVLVTFWAHLRIGEAVALQWRDIDLDAGTLSVARQDVELRGQGAVEAPPKVGSTRTVYLPEQAMEALRERWSTHPGTARAYVFTREDGTKLRAWHAEHAWKAARRKHDLDEFRIHDLRHASLTLTAQLGATLKETMRRGGHASPAAALRYQHAAQSRDFDLAAMLSKAGRHAGEDQAAGRLDRAAQVS